MGKKHNGIITTTGNFNFASDHPLDDRAVVEYYDDLAGLISAGVSYEGMEVYVIENLTTYKLISGNWCKTIVADSDDSVTVSRLLVEDETNIKGDLAVGQRLSVSDDIETTNGDVKAGTHSLKNKANKSDLKSLYVTAGQATGTKLGDNATAEGINTTASENYSHAEGNKTSALAEGAHAEGGIAKNNDGDAYLGVYTKAEGYCSHAEGGSTMATGWYSHSEGYRTQAKGKSSHAEGHQTVAQNTYAHAEGYLTTAYGSQSHAENVSHVIYNKNTEYGGKGVTGIFHGGSDTEIINNRLELYKEHKPQDDWLFSIAYGQGSHVEGADCLAMGSQSHAEGKQTMCSGAYSHSEGYRTQAHNSSHAEGYQTKADKGGHSEGWNTNATAKGSHSEGGWNSAKAIYSHTEGCGTTVDGGYKQDSSENYLDEDGKPTTDETKFAVIGEAAHAEGYYTKATGPFQHVQGKYTNHDANGYSELPHVVGWGSKDKPRNIHWLTSSGKGYFTDGTATTGADYAEFFEWLDGNPLNEDRIGLAVTIQNEKIKLANAGDLILGIVSGQPAVLGDSYEQEWKYKYVTDKFGRIIYDQVEEFRTDIDPETGEEIQISLGFFSHPRISPDYDPNQKFISRDDRPEWDKVGMLGKLYALDDGTCVPGAYATVGIDGVLTHSVTPTNMYVMKRTAEDVVWVLFK